MNTAELERLVEELKRDNSALRAALEESQRTQHKLVDVEQRLHAVVGHAPVVVFTTDHDGIFTLSEGRGLALLALKPGEVVGRSVFDVYRDFPKICGDMRACLRGELIIATVEVGGLLWESMYVPKIDGAGAVVGVSGVAWDVTARVRAEEKTRALEQQLRQAQKMEMVGTLAGGIAHDFNNILAPVMGYSELALRALPPQHPARADVEQIRKAARRARDVVEQILIFSRRSDQVKRPVHLQLVVDEALQLLQSMVPTNVEIRQDIDHSALASGDLILADASQMHQVVMNLALNALHAMRNSGGLLEVRLTQVNLDEPAAQSKGLPPGRYLTLTVTDQGEGMSEEILSRVFEPFFTTKRARGGSGLGLSVVHGIVHSHGGAIHVSSSPGHGAVFQAFLPMVSAQNTSEVHDEPMAAVHGQGRVLVVDDELAIVTMLHRLLEAYGYQVTGFTAAEQALATFIREPHAFDAVITDRAMPRMSGIELATAIRKARPDMPVLLITGFLDADARRELHRDIAGVIPKPFESHVAIRMLQDAMARLTADKPV